MASVYDVAKYILECCGEVTAMKLQKLAYYSQVWTIVWDEELLFEEEIQAWVNGSVIPALYQTHRGRFKVSSDTYNHGDCDNLTESQKDNINRVLSVYGKYTGQQLSDINHQEDPWIKARSVATANGIAVITTASIHEYHSGIFNIG